MKQKQIQGRNGRCNNGNWKLQYSTSKNGQNINKETENLNSTIDELDLIYNIGHATQQQYLNIFISGPWEHTLE